MKNPPVLQSSGILFSARRWRLPARVAQHIRREEILFEVIHLVDHLRLVQQQLEAAARETWLGKRVAHQGEGRYLRRFVNGWLPGSSNSHFGFRSPAILALTPRCRINAAFPNLPELRIYAAAPPK